MSGRTGKRQSALAPGSNQTWIVSTSLRKPDAETRQLIRSQVMRGKNTREQRRARKSTQPSPEEKARSASVSPDAASAEPSGVWVIVTPQKIASELTLFGFNIELKPYMPELIHRAFTLIKPATFTAEAVLVDINYKGMFCFSNLAQCPALAHVILFTAQGYHDSLHQLPFSGLAQFHLAKTLQHLQEDLNDNETAMMHSTMAVVVSLATAAVFFGDIETTRKHMDGLYKMARLRGGFHSLEEGSMIEHKAQRIDFGLALATGSPTRFFPSSVAWSPNLASGGAANRFPEFSMLHTRPDPRLLNVWADMRAFSSAANTATASGTRMSPTIFTGFTTSAPNRLTNLRFDPASLPELLRLCMLTYLKVVLTPFHGFGKHLTFLSSRLKAALLAQQPLRTSGALDKLLFWAQFMAALAVFEDFDREWLQAMVVQTAAALEIQTWVEARLVLKGFLWIDILLDKSAERLFDEWLRVEPA